MLHIEAVERIFRVAAQHVAVGRVYHTSPISLRFTKASEAYMSMMHGRDTMMIELILLNDTEGGFELLTAYEQELYAVGGRPHWGQFNILTGSHGLLDTMYPGYRAWQRIRALIDPDGRFDSPFARRAGITRGEFVP
jgi:hypothetical protein